MTETPTPLAGRVRTSGPVDARLWRRTDATQRYLLGAVLVGTATAVVIVGQAWLLAHAIGGVFATRDARVALSLAPGLAGVFAARAMLSWLSSVLANRASAAVKSQFRTDIMAARLSQPDSAIDSASLVVMVTQGLDALDGYFARYLPQLVLAVTVPLVVGVAILSTDFISALIVALTLPLIPIFMILVGWMTRTLVARRWRVHARLAHHFADLVAGLPTLQVFGRARAQAAGVRRTEDAHRRETMIALRVSFLSALVLELLATLSVAVVAVGIGLRVVDDQLDLVTALFILILAPEIYLPLRQVGTHYHDSADGLAAAERAFRLIDAAALPARSSAPVPDLATGTIEFCGVRVRYPEASRDALSDLNLVIGAGEAVVLTGSSGAGKSTALAVLLGFVRPTAGRVLIGGRALSDLDRRQWLARVAWVPQQPALLAGTVGRNVALGAPDAPLSRVRSALGRAGAADLDLDRIVEAGTEGLSAGEIRRVALARALLRVDCGGGQLLIMDEPTAGLDADTELAALAGVRALGVGAIVVSHRPAVVASADRVVDLSADLTVR